MSIKEIILNRIKGYKRVKHVNHSSLLADRIEKQRLMRAKSLEKLASKGEQPLPAVSDNRPEGMTDLEWSIYQQALQGVFK